jgi:hypothetical protein
MFKSRTPLLCRTCAKPIRKHSTIVWVHEKPTPHHHPSAYSRYIYGELRSKEDCTQHTNQQVLSVGYTTDYKDGEPQPETCRVRKFTEWDGETYEDEFFCSSTCAQAFGRMAARSGKVQSAAYVNATSKKA